MKNRATRPLVILNIALLALVITLGVARNAGANGSQPDRARGAYTMVSGAIQGGSNDVAYIIDTVNQELVAVDWNAAGSQIRVIGYRNLAVDSKQRGNR